MASPVPGGRFGPRSLPLLIVTVLFTAGMLVLGYANKARCVGPRFNQSGQSEPDLGVRISRDVCYSDIQYLWVGRQVNQHVFPYIHGSYHPATREISGGTLEYPVLTGMVIYLTGLPASNDAQYLLDNAIILASCGLLVGFLLCRLAGIRAWWWALAPPLVFYSFHNWDLLAVACVVGAFALVAATSEPAACGPATVAESRTGPGRRASRLVLAAVLLGVGGAFKLYPLMFVLPLALWVGLGTSGVQDRSRTARWRQAGGLVAAAGGTFLLANLPFMIAGFGGWWASFQFQWARPIDPSTNSIWFWATRPFSDSDNAWLQTTLGRWSTVSTGLGLALAVLAGWWRSRQRGIRSWRPAEARSGEFPWLQVSAAMLCAYLLLNKVHSPQYVLWLLPFFVLLRIRAGWIVAYFVADAAMGIGFFRWQYLMLQRVPSGVYEAFPLQSVMIGVWGRAALLVGLFVAFLRSDSVLDPCLVVPPAATAPHPNPELRQLDPVSPPS